MLVLSHESALAVTRIASLARMLVAHEHAGFCATNLSSATAPLAREAHDIAGKLGIPMPLHVALPDNGARRARASVRTHVLGEPVDPTNIIHLTDDIYVVSPELLAVQLSRGSDVENRVLLMSELASDYAIDPGAHSGIVGRPHLVTRARLEAFCNAHDELLGTSAVRGVLPSVVEEARSPKEVELHVVLSRVRRCGGWEIPNLRANVRIDLTPEAALLARRKSLIADLMLFDHDLEYDGNDFHLTREANESDKRRANALRMMGINLTVLTAGQVHDWGAFQIIAKYLQVLAGVHLRKPSHAVIERQHALWERVFFAERRSGRMVLDASSSPATRYQSLVAY